MTTATLSAYDEVLKTFYLPAIQEQLNHSTILADLIDVNEEDVSGKDAKIEMQYGKSTGIGARGDGEALPAANYQKFIQATVPMQYNYGRIQVSGIAIAATRDERGAYAKVLDTEIKGIVTDLKDDINRQLWGAGHGLLARWRSGAAGTLTVQKKYRGNSAGGDGFGSTFGAKYMEVGDPLTPVVATISSATVGTYVVDATDIAPTVIVKTEADYDTLTITDPSVTEAIGTFYIRFNNAVASLGADGLAAGVNRKEMMGLRGIVTDTDLDDITFNTGAFDGLTVNDPLQGIAADTYTWFQAVVKAHASGRYAGQRALTLNLMDTMFDSVEENAGKDYGPDLVLTTRALRREYADLCRADRRYVNTMVLDGGWKAIDYNGIPLTVDNDAIDGEIYFLSTRDLQLYRMSDYDWMNKDGAILSRVSGYDAYEAVLFRYAELGCKRRNSHGVLCDLAYTL
uniref:Putative capsid protein n=1 Tax=viral metagenome TaxID=1070528 RepID=A0A6H1ZDK4_9ZZZZ